MKHAFKTALTLVATLALLLAPGGFVSSVSAAPVKPVGCCCDKCPTHCCVGKNSSAPAEPFSAIPSVSASHLLQALLPVLNTLISVGLSAPPTLCFVPSPSSVGLPVPLYVRTHSFLI